MSRSTSYDTIWQIVQQIPRGKVATYGQIATESGFPGLARLVGYALHALPHRSGVPWQRVINSKGRISFPCGTNAYKRQRRLLMREGVIFKGDTIDLRRFGWLSVSERRQGG